jgi:hypothetical protein
MNDCANIISIIHAFENIRNENKTCGEEFCTTCGGYGPYIIRHIDKDTRLSIKKTLSEISLKDLDAFGKWRNVLWGIDKRGVISVSIREAKKLNLNDIRALDWFLFYSRIYRFGNDEFSQLYHSILDKGISAAIENADYSLTETLLLVLKKSAVEYPKLLKLAFKMSEINIQMQRVLYNCLREIAPEVRNYVGSGKTVYPYSMYA